MPDIKELETQLKTTFESFKTQNDVILAEVKATGSATQEHKNALDRMQDALDANEKKLAEVQTKLNRPLLGGDNSTGNDPEVKAFADFLRKGEKMGPDSLKALATDSDVDGGYLLAPATRGAMIDLLIKVSPVRALASVITLSQGDTWEAPKTTGEPDAGWTSERGARPQTNSPTVGLVRIVAQEQYAAPRATQKMLDDAGFNVEQWLAGLLARKFAKLEGTAFISGSGLGQPEGLLTAPGVTEVVSGSAGAITADGIMDLVFSLDEEYAVGASLLMKRSTLRDIRKLKDTTGQYLWQPGLAGASPSTILDYGYTVCDDMPAIAANAYPVIFGNIAEAYQIVDRQGIVTQRDPFTAKPFVEFYTTRRVGGGVKLAAALRKLKISV